MVNCCDAVWRLVRKGQEQVSEGEGEREETSEWKER
jgi:hypothetical protein